MTFVLDASAVLRLTDRDAGFERVRDLFDGAADGNFTLLISAINWGEVFGVLARRYGAMRAREITDGLVGLPWMIVDVSAADAEQAGTFKASFKIPYADAFAATLAMKHSATLVTADYDFQTLPRGTVRVEFLSQK